MRARTLSALFAFSLVSLGTSSAFAATYQVGPSRTIKTLAAVAPMLAPGDLVEVDGDATYGSVVFQKPGTASKKITIRGIAVNGKRPVVSGGSNTIEAQADHYVFEGLDLTGGSFRCFYHHADDVTLRDSVIHDCPAHGLLGADADSGSLTMEYVEVYKCGNGTQQHQIYMATDETAHPGSVFRMQHCYVHDGNGGNNVKSRAERNEIYYNWVEGALYHELELIGPDGQDEGLAREDSDVVGNVLVKGNTFHVVRFGGDGTGQTFGRYRFVNNTVVAGQNAVFRLFDGIESVEMHNNVFLRPGGSVNVYRDTEAAWVAGQLIAGSNNWVQTGASNLPAQWTGTLQGASPGLSADQLPQAGSPLIDAGNGSLSGVPAHPFPNPLPAPLFHPPIHALQAVGSATPRPVDAVIDIGAFEAGSGGGAGGAGGTAGSGGSTAGSGGSTAGSGGSTGGAAGDAGAGGSTAGSAGAGGSTCPFPPCGVAGTGGTAGTGGSPGSCDKTDSAVDADGDGYFPPVDCNDCDPNTNPGALDIVNVDLGGNPLPADQQVDEDCSGTAATDNNPCDAALALDSADAMDGARAIELCQVATDNPKTWGVISAKYTQMNPNNPLPGSAEAALGHGIEPAWGPNVSPQLGTSMLVLSSGSARTPGQPDYKSPGGFSKGYTSANPPGFPLGATGCSGNPSSGQLNDSVALNLKLRAPTNAKSFSFKFKFYTYEFPVYVCTQYNDVFTAAMFPTPSGGDPPTGNISFDSQGNALSVNNAFLDVCKPQTAGGKVFSCLAGVNELAGTGFDDATNPHGATTWLQTTAPVDPGSEFDITFGVSDAGDGILDSTIIIDDFEWSASPGTVQTGNACKLGGTGTCPTCINAAVSAPKGCCSPQYAACTTDNSATGCNTLLNCLSICTTQTCRDACFASHPEGKPAYDAVLACFYGSGATDDYGACGKACQLVGSPQ